MRLNAIVLLVLLVRPAVALAGIGEAAAKVREGVAHFHAEDYEQAAKAFAAADVALPDNQRIHFDRACTHAARGDADKAVELFQEAALSRDPDLAVRSHYNLGSLAAERARALFGETPQDATPEVRTEGLALLAQAVSHYRDCLDVDTNHADARHNLEVIRLWIKHMQALWEERDRQKQRDEMGLLEFLQMLDAQQRLLRAATRALADQPDSPQRRQALLTTESSQRKLAEEIEPLKEKIRATLQAPQQSPQQPAQPGKTPVGPQAGASVSPEAKEAIRALSSLADDARQAMFSAADRLHGGSVAEAVESQTEAVELLDQICIGVVPFPGLLQRAIGTQQGLIDQVAPAVENVESPDEQHTLDHAESAWDQRFVSRWAEALVPKAEEGLKGLENVDPSALTVPPGGSGPPGGAGPPGAPDPDAMKKQIEGLKQSMQKAVELAPKVKTLTDEAATHLDEEKPAEALPKQEQALKLLKEIAEPLPRQDQQQQQDEQDQDQEQKDQQQDQKQQGEDQQQQQAKKPQDLSKQQAEAVLRKVRERQRERRELDKQLQRRIYRPEAVEKDW